MGSFGKNAPAEFPAKKKHIIRFACVALALIVSWAALVNTFKREVYQTGTFENTRHFHEVLYYAAYNICERDLDDRMDTAEKVKKAEEDIKESNLFIKLYEGDSLMVDNTLPRHTDDNMVDTFSFGKPETPYVFQIWTDSSCYQKPSRIENLAPLYTLFLFLRKFRLLPILAVVLFGCLAIYFTIQRLKDTPAPAPNKVLDTVPFELWLVLALGLCWFMPSFYQSLGIREWIAYLLSSMVALSVQ